MDTEEFWKAAHRRIARRYEDEIRRLLSSWVSELEPSICYSDEAHHLLGLECCGVLVVMAWGTSP